jgi:uncharacterized membrane protein
MSNPKPIIPDLGLKNSRMISILVSPAGRKIRGILFILVSSLLPCFGQLSHGGRPMAIDAEKKSISRYRYSDDILMPAVNIDSLKAIDALPGNRVGGIKFAHTLEPLY